MIEALDLLSAKDGAEFTIKDAAGQVVSQLEDTVRAMVLRCTAMEAKKDLLDELLSYKYVEKTVNVNVERVFTFLQVRAMLCALWSNPCIHRTRFEKSKSIASDLLRSIEIARYRSVAIEIDHNSQTALPMMARLARVGAWGIRLPRRRSP